MNARGSNCPPWIVLGAGTATPHCDRSPSGHLFWAPEGPVLVDMGPGTLWRLAAQGVHLRDLAAIFLSHRHLDHCLDMPALLFGSRIPGHGRTLPLPVYMGPGMDDHMDRLSQALGHWFEPRGFEVDWRVLDPGPDGMNISLGGASARIAAVVHDETSVALRVQSAGVEVVYSGDSDDCPALTGLCYGADVAVLECSTAVDNKVPGHLTAREVARIACQAQVGGVVLVHMYPELDGVDLAAQIAAYGYRGWVVPACDGYVVEV